MKMEETELWESPERVSIPAQGCVWNQEVLFRCIYVASERIPTKLVKQKWERMTYWVMRNQDVKLPWGMTPGTRTMSKNTCICLFFHLSLHLSALLSSVLDLLSDRLSAPGAKDGHKQLQACLILVTGDPSGKGDPLSQKFQQNFSESHWPHWNDVPIEEPITVARGMGYAHWPGSPVEPGAHIWTPWIRAGEAVAPQRKIEMLFSDPEKTNIA